MAKKKLKGSTVRLANAPFVEGDTADTRRWVLVAVEGEYRGYNGGRSPFRFTKDTFEAVVRNLRAHPAYEADEQGEGKVDLVQWDFEHASALDTAEAVAAAAIEGLPAQGWISDVKVVDGEDGAELHALSRFLEPALGYVKAGKYRGASVELDFARIDPNSGQDVGPSLLAVALTNRPFIREVWRVAASSMYFATASSPMEAVHCLRQLFGLGVTSGVADVLAELNRVGEWASAGTAPLGVDVSDVVGAMRSILGLPALAGLPEVLDNARGIVQRLLDESGAPASQPAPAAATGRGNDMDLKLLAAKLNVRETEDAVAGAITELTDLRAALCAKLSVTGRESNKVLLDAVAEGGSARDRLVGLFKALGMEDYEGAVEKIATLIQQADELKKLMPELEGLRSAAAATEAASAEADVTEAMASYRVPEEAREAMVLLRSSAPDKFKAKFPKVSAPKVEPRGVTLAHKAALLSQVAGGNGGAGPQGASAPTGGGSNVIRLSDYEGANPTQRAMSYLKLNYTGWDKLTLEEQFKLALNFKRQAHVVAG